MYNLKDVQKYLDREGIAIALTDVPSVMKVYKETIKDTRRPHEMYATAAAAKLADGTSLWDRGRSFDRVAVEGKIMAVQEFAESLDDKVILDAGCANGLQATFLGQHARIVYGIDEVDEMVLAAFARGKKYPSSNVRFGVATMNDLPFGRETFDIAVAFDSLGTNESSPYRKENGRAVNHQLEELSRVLKKDGLLVVSGQYIDDYELGVHEDRLRSFVKLTNVTTLPETKDLGFHLRDEQQGINDYISVMRKL